MIAFFQELRLFFGKEFYDDPIIYNEIDNIYAQNGYVADNHDFLALPNGNYILFCSIFSLSQWTMLLQEVIQMPW